MVGWKRLLCYELLQEKETIKSKYCSQLDKMKAALDEKHLKLVNRKLTVSQQDNARLHISLITRQKLSQLGWKVLIHLLYSQDTAPSDVYLFQSL